jgi:hypothetical protein
MVKKTKHQFERKGFVVRILRSHPERTHWVGLASPVAKRKHAALFSTREEAQRCVAELRTVYENLTAKIIPL